MSALPSDDQSVIEQTILHAIGDPALTDPSMTFDEAGVDSLGLLTVSLVVEELAGAALPGDLMASIASVREAAEWVVTIRRRS